MVVKGRSVNAFHLSLSVSNYPMKERTKAELEEVQYVSNQRKIEKAECDASKDVVSGPTSARNTPLVGKNKQTIFYFFSYTHCAFDIADPRSVQDASYI